MLTCCNIEHTHGNNTIGELHLDTNDSITSELLNSAKARLASPLLAFFVTTWIFHNWKLITAIFTLKLPYYEFVGRLETFFNHADLLWLPLLKSLIIFILYLLVSLVAHFIYSWFKFALSKIDSKVEKRDLYLNSQYDIYSTAFYVVSNSSFVQETLKHAVIDERAAKMISSWQKSWQSNKSLENAVEQLVNREPSEAMNSISDAELVELVNLDLLTKKSSGDYYMTYKGAYFYQLKKPETSSTSLLEAIQKAGGSLETLKQKL